MKILPSELCTDAEFIRRVYLDLTGLPPTAEDVRAFLADTRDARVKREALVDRLIGTPDYVDTGRTSGPTCSRSTASSWASKGAVAFRNWIRGQVAANTPYDKFVQVDPHGHRLEQGQPAGLVLQGPPRAGGHDGEHHAALPGRAVQLQQVPRPPLRALDPGPVLPDGRLLRPGRPEGRPGQRRADDRRHRRRGAQAALRDGGRHGLGRGHPRPDQAGRRAEVPVQVLLPEAGRERAAAGRAGRVADLEGQPVLRPELRQPALGLPLRRRHHRAARRHPRRQPADQPRAARLPDRGVRQERVQRPPHRAADLHVADVSALGRRRTSGTPTTR